MPIVTALRATRAGRVAVHLDGTFFCSVSATLLARERLFEGRELDEAEAAALRAAASAEQVHSDALRLLAHRARSRHELRQRLLRKGHDRALVDDTLARLEGEGLLDDDAFALAYVTDKRNLNGWGEERIRRGLAQLGVPPDTVERALRAREADVGHGRSGGGEEGAASGGDAVADADAELRRALAALGRRRREGAAPDVVRRRALAALRRRGFTAEVAWRAVREWLGSDGLEDAPGGGGGGDDAAPLDDLPADA